MKGVGMLIVSIRGINSAGELRVGISRAEV